MIENGFIDGVFDSLHYGHIMALFQSKQKCKTLFAATHLDEDVLSEKGTYPIFNYNERYNLLNNCKFIDVLYDYTPYNTTVEILDNFNCKQFFHGEDNIDKSPILDIKNANRLTVYNRTNGISTTNFIERIYNFKKNKIVKKNNDFVYLNYIFNEINCVNKKNINVDNVHNVVLLKCPWDILNINHINLISSIKLKYPDYLLYIDLVSEDLSYDIFNKEEMAITLLGIKHIDAVLLDLSDYNKNILNLVSINTNLLKNSVIDDSFINNIKELNSYKFNIIHNVNLDLYSDKLLENINMNFNLNFNLKIYNDILTSQFSNVLLFLKNIQIKDNDIIVFDIDEVCLNNLMYNGVYIYDFENDIYNFKNGLIPLNTHCSNLFDYIHENNIKYSFVTGRKDYIRNITIENLNLVKLNKYIDLYTCFNKYIGDISIYKQKCKKDIINKGYNIICCVGDQISDINGINFGIQFLIFNPFYFT